MACQASTVDLIGALSDFNDVAVGVTDVAADLAVLGDPGCSIFGLALPSYLRSMSTGVAFPPSEMKGRHWRVHLFVF